MSVRSLLRGQCATAHYTRAGINKFSGGKGKGNLPARWNQSRACIRKDELYNSYVHGGPILTQLKNYLKNDLTLS